MSKGSAELIKELRERTGVGLAKCKSALDEMHGDIEKAIEHLRKTGIASAVKKEARVTKEGRVEFLDTPRAIVLMEMNAETDFVVNNDRFRQFHKQMIELLAQVSSNNVEEFLQVKLPSEPNKTVDDIRKELISVLGENVNISRIVTVKKEGNRSLGLYSHMQGRILVVVELAGSAQEGDFAKEIAMQVAAEAPEYLSVEDVPKELVAKELEIAQSQAPKDKPQQMVEKIVQGKVKAFYDQVCLLQQKYVKDNAITIAELLAKKSREVGKEITIVRFIRLQAGN